MRRGVWSIFVCLLVTFADAGAATKGKTQNIVLITLDGARWQEIFAGLDLEILKSVTKNAKVEDTDLYKKYWAPTPEERREKLMPFLWGTWVKQHGSIAGNKGKHSIVQVTNNLRFSYPGYSEILTGQAHDDVIKTNDKKRNPYPSVLEFLKHKLRLDVKQVAAFASWDTMDWIDEHQEGVISTNSGFKAYAHPDPIVRELGKFQFETDTPWDSVRNDAYTFRFAMAHLDSYKPRVLYISLGETDDWAHGGNYARMIQALTRTDTYLRRLWENLQSKKQYRDKTTLLLTVDHGRGSSPANWADHGEKVEEAKDIWLAVLSPDCDLRGEWTDRETIYQNQIAATLCRFLGLDYSENNPTAGKPIALLFK